MAGNCVRNSAVSEVLMVSRSFKIRDFSISLLLKSMLSISRDVISSGIMPCIDKVNHKELFIIFGLYLARD